MRHHKEQNPEQYVQPMPLPIPSHKGIKIQARCDTVYNPTYPTRDMVRRENYKRRQLQLSEQGFRSVIYKPYQGIGDPFYLDEKKLILHALGQWDESKEAESLSFSDSSGDEEDRLQHGLQQKPFTPANFMLRRARKDLNTLPKEVLHGRDLIRNVHLGHGLFQILRKERQSKTVAKQAELRQKQEQQRNEWQPPKSDSQSDEETDDELQQDHDLQMYGVALTTEVDEPPAPVQDDLTKPVLPGSLAVADNRSVAFRDLTNSVGGRDGVMSARSTRASSGRSGRTSRKKAPASRPYTPAHSNICEYTSGPDKQSLFRQLCALYWILEAMNTEPPIVMAPISTCWNLKDIGGSKTSFGKQQKDKMEFRWKQFLANPMMKPDPVERLYRPSNKRNIRLSMKGGGRRTSGHPRSSSIASSVAPSPCGSQSQLSTAGMPLPPSNVRLDQATIPEDSEVSTQRESALSHIEPDQEDPSTTGTQEDRASVMENSSAKSEISVNLYPAGGRRSSIRGRGGEPETPPPRQPPATAIGHRAGDLNGSVQTGAQIIETLTRHEEDPRLAKLVNMQEKRSSRNLRAESNIRPKSSAAVVEYQSGLPSHRLSTMPLEMRQKWSEVGEEKALILHDTLEAIDRERMRKLQNKFTLMPADTSLHRALSEMRTSTNVEDDNREKRRRSSIHQQWYIELQGAIPEDLKLDWYFDRILDKLSKYGLVEASKQSAYKFLKVLTGLRDWEICAPDITASIEFCREKIVEMSVDEYEEWFIQQFPSVIRPHTAPAASTSVTSTRPKASKSVVLSEGNREAPKSAPAASHSLQL